MFQRFRDLFGLRLIRRWLQSSPSTFYDRLFTPLVTLWHLVFQRLDLDHSLDRVLVDAHAGGADALSPRGKRLWARIKSLATAAFSDARQRLPLAVIHQAWVHSATEIRTGAQNTCWQDWTVVLLDGSTVRLRSWADMPRDFPPHGGSKGRSYWCLMRGVAGFCLTTGVAMATAMGASSVSEQALAVPVLAQLPPKSLVVADRNFGIFSVAQAAVLAQVQVLARLTKVRARKLARSNGFGLRRQMDRPVNWTASAHDQADPQSSQTTVAGRLIARPVHRPGFRAQVIYLFTTLLDPLAYPAEVLLELYGKRWQVELDLRFVKTEMDLGALECKSPEMARKEWVAGLLAYNVIRSLMVAAAAQAGISIWALSFSRTRQFLQAWIQKQGWRTTSAATGWPRLLLLVARSRQPKRRKKRPPEPRALRYFTSCFPPLKGSRAPARKIMKTKN